MKIPPRSYSQLQPEDRLTIASLLQQGRGIREIARVLARPASTISREIKRNTCARRGYASRLYAHPRGELRRELLACLRWARSKRRSRSAGQDRSRLSDALSIHLREPDIDDRILPGHWEGDFIKGALNQSSVGVLVERVSRLVSSACRTLSVPRS